MPMGVGVSRMVGSGAHHLMSACQTHRTKYFWVRQELWRYAGGASAMFARTVSFPRSGPFPRMLKAVYPGDEPNLQTKLNT